MKIVIVIALIAIIFSLSQALFAMSSGAASSGRMVRALSIRIGLSVLLFALLMLAWYFGIITPRGM